MGPRAFLDPESSDADLAAPGAYGIMTRGDGCHLYDIYGNKYIDGMAGLFLKNIGHNHPEIAQAVYEQMTTLAYANSGAYSTVPGVLLAKKSQSWLQVT